MTRLSLHLLDQTFARSDKARPSDNLYDCIVTAAGGDELKRIRGHRLLPDEIASCLHTLRILSNKADHLAEGIKQTANRAENAINLFLDAVEWYYCEYERGPRLPTIYSESQYRTPELEIISVYCTDEYELDVTLRNTADQPVFRRLRPPSVTRPSASQRRARRATTWPAARSSPKAGKPAAAVRSSPRATAGPSSPFRRSRCRDAISSAARTAG